MINVTSSNHPDTGIYWYLAVYINMILDKIQGELALHLQYSISFTMVGMREFAKAPELLLLVSYLHDFGISIIQMEFTCNLILTFQYIYLGYVLWSIHV